MNYFNEFNTENYFYKTRLKMAIDALMYCMYSLIDLALNEKHEDD